MKIDLTDKEVEQLEIILLMHITTLGKVGEKMDGPQKVKVNQDIVDAGLLLDKITLERGTKKKKVPTNK